MNPSPAPSVQMILDPTDLAMRVVAFLAKNGALMIVLGGALGVAGFALGSLRPQQYVQTAVVELGGRNARTAIESPLIASQRIIGFGRARSLVENAETNVEVKTRRATPDPYLTRFLDVTVRANSAAATSAVLEGVLSDIVNLHAAFHESEYAINTREIDRYRALVTSVEDAQRKLATPDARLAATLYEIHTSQTEKERLMLESKMPKTRVTEKRLVPFKTQSLSIPASVGGVLLGFLLAGILGAIRAFSAPTARV